MSRRGRLDGGGVYGHALNGRVEVGQRSGWIERLHTGSRFGDEPERLRLRRGQGGAEGVVQRAIVAKAHIGTGV